MTEIVKGGTVDKCGNVSGLFILSRALLGLHMNVALLMAPLATTVTREARSAKDSHKRKI
jgi:hypothetical protein